MEGAWRGVEDLCLWLGEKENKNQLTKKSCNLGIRWVKLVQLHTYARTHGKGKKEEDLDGRGSERDSERFVWEKHSSWETNEAALS